MYFGSCSLFIILILCFLAEYWAGKELQTSALCSFRRISQCICSFNWFKWIAKAGCCQHCVSRCLAGFIFHAFTKFASCTQFIQDALCRAADVSSWTKVEILLEATGTDPNSRLELRSSKKGVIWFDQVSLMPTDTYKVSGLELSCRHLEKTHS